MMLALLVIAGLVSAAVAAVAVRRYVIHSWVAVPVVTLVPLLGWLGMHATADVERSAWEFRVQGQYHRLTDTLHVGTDPAADVVLQDAALPDTRVDVNWHGGRDSLHVSVSRSSLPVLVGGVPLNARRLDRRAVLRSGSDSLTIARPWYCFRCDWRIVTDDEGRREVRIAPMALLHVGTDTVRVFRANGALWASATAGSTLRVDGDTLPASAIVRSDTLQVGVPAQARVLLRAAAAEHRLNVLFTGDAAPAWTLPLVDGDSLRFLVAATDDSPVPGTLRVINPGAVAPGAAREPYGGMLQQRGDAWEWLAGGETRPFAPNSTELLPGGGAATGHLVELRQFDTDPGSARNAVILAWLVGALVLAWALRLLHPEPLAMRVLLLGAVYTLVAVRGVLAFRAWLAPPHDANSPVAFIALLLALPLFTALLHVWQLRHTTAPANPAAPAHARARRGRILRSAPTATLSPLLPYLAVVGPVALAAAGVMPLVLPAWRADILKDVAAAVIMGLAGLAVVNRLLLTGTRDPRRGEPIGAVTAPVHESFTQRQFLSALVLLGVFAFLLLLTTQLVRFGTLLAVIGWGITFGIVLLATSAPRTLIRPPRTRAAAAIAAGAAVAASVIALLLGRGWIVAAIALIAGGGIAWLVAARPVFRLRPVHARDLVGPPLMVALLASLVAVLVPGLLASIRVLAEYGLALAGLLVIARIFAILWFRHTRDLAARPHGVRRATLPGATAVGVVLVMLAAVIYVPLAIFDTGLVLLFFAATMAAVFAGFFMIGSRALAGALAIGVVVAFVGGMFVRPSDLRDGSADLTTARIRYAATYHPEALQQHMLGSQDGRPLTIVRTLHQYWGMRHFAAGGTTGRGYYDADYADWIVPRPVALTENVFSTFVLSEHGWLGGAAVLLCYLVMALALLYGAARACARTRAAPRAVLLIGVAAFWVVPAFYIAAANGLLVPLTGQNMPMLGLLSAADVALATWLAGLGLLALPPDSASGAEHVRSGGWATRLRSAVWGIGGTFTAAAALVIVLLWRPAHAQVGDFALDGVTSNVETLVAQGALTAVGAQPDTVAVAPGAERHPFLRQGGFLRSRVARANAIARGEGAGAGCLDSDPLVRVRDDGGIAVFSAMCSLRAVVEGRRDWQGVLAATTPVSSFAISDGRTWVMLDPGSTATAAAAGDCAGNGRFDARTARLGCGDGAALVRFGTSAPILEVGAARLNGDSIVAPAVLSNGDHLRVPGSADAWVLEVPRGALAYPRWENGVTRRIQEPTIQPWLAQLDTQLTRGLSNTGRTEWNAVVTLRPALQAGLQQALDEACSAAAGVRRCSALIADPYTGRVLALGATFRQSHRFLSADPNLRNHPAASAIKPIIAAAAVDAFPSLRELQVQHTAQEYDVIANTPLRPPVRAARLYPAATVPWTGFLGASDNLYAITLGFLAASDAAGGAAAAAVPALRGTATTSLMMLDGELLRGQPTWVAGGINLSRSPLAQSMGRMYAVYPASADAPAFDRDYWAAAAEAGALVPSGDLQRVTPEPVALGMDRFTSPREYAAFLLGGGRNRWNNLALVQAFSRLYTGHAVTLHVLDSVGATPLAPAAPPLEQGATAARAVMDGLAAVTAQPWGTGNSLRGVFAPSVHWRAKTGTLFEREWNGSILLWAGGPQQDEDGPRAAAGSSGRAPCAAAGILTVEMEPGASPDGRATALFRSAIAPLLQRELGWNGNGCR